MLKLSTPCKLLLLSSFCILAVATITTAVSSPSCAQSSAGCAPDTWTAMANQAAIQTRRQDVMNKRYIAKADSVLQYSCFFDDIVNTAENTGPIFSTGDHWVGLEVETIETGTIVDIYESGGPELSPEALGEGLALTVTAPLESYLESNFNHHYLGGTTHPEGAIAGEPALCYSMGAIWQAAKCKNFDGTAIFYSLETLEDIPNIVDSDDPRAFPAEMVCG